MTVGNANMKKKTNLKQKVWINYTKCPKTLQGKKFTDNYVLPVNIGIIDNSDILKLLLWKNGPLNIFTTIHNTHVK